MSSSTDKPMGRFKKSWLLMKGSWKALKMDKEIVTIPVIGVLAAIGMLAVVGLITFLARDTFFVTSSVNGMSDTRVQPIANVLWVIALALISGVGMIFSGAIVHAALERFKGNDPTVRTSIKAALKRGGSLVGFGAFSYIIGYLLSEIAQRIPFFGGKLIAWLAGSAWNVASFFAIPVIVSSDQAVNPVQATKKSINLIKKVWGESLIVSFGIAIFAAIGFIVYVLTFGLLMAFIANASNGAVVPQVILTTVGVVGLFALMLIYTTLESFAKAAIYYYATTGEAPAHFDERMMRAAFTPKKARKLFGV